MELKVDSPNVNYTPQYIESKYEYQYTKAEKSGQQILVSFQNCISLKTH